MVHVGAAIGQAILHIPFFFNRLVAVTLHRRAIATFNIDSEAVANFTTMVGWRISFAVIFPHPSYKLFWLRAPFCRCLWVCLAFAFCCRY
jgi:hypothetical protein